MSAPMDPTNPEKTFIEYMFGEVLCSSGENVDNVLYQFFNSKKFSQWTGCND